MVRCDIPLKLKKKEQNANYFAQKKGPRFEGLFALCLVFYKLFTCFAKLLLRFEALFKCITFFLASLSSIAVTSGKSFLASSLSDEARSDFTAFLVVLA
jgi:hypothetical protein